MGAPPGRAGPVASPGLFVSYPSPPAHPTRPASLSRWLLPGLLLLALLLLGVYNDPVLDGMTTAWQRGLGLFGLGHSAAAMQQGIDAGITRRFLPAVASYAALYLGLCLLLLWLLLRPAQWQLAWRLYAGGLALYVAIAVLGKLAGNAQWAYRLSRHLLDFIVSPLPVGALYVLFRAGFGPAEQPV